MIITQNPHGLAPDEGDILHDYVFRDEVKPPRLVGVFNMIGGTPSRAMRAMELMRDASRASIAFQHITINPKYNLSEQQRALAVSRILEVLGAEEHGYVLVEHFKNRATPGRADHHFHLILAHVGPDLRALDMSHSYARLEAVARCLEVDFGEELTPTTRPEAVAYFARVMGRDDVAERVLGMHDKYDLAIVAIEIGSVDSRVDDCASIDVAARDITTGLKEGPMHAVFSDHAVSNSPPPDRHSPGMFGAPDGDDSSILSAGSLSAEDFTSEVGFFEVEIRNIGDRVAIESMEPTETAWNRDETISPPLDPMEIKASTRAESERRDDARTGRIDAATREGSPKPTAETARIRILQKLDNHEKRLQHQLQTLKTPVGEPEKLTRARSVLAAAKRRLQEATTKEETARNKIAVLDAQRPNSLIAKITGKAAKFAVRYEEAKRQRADAMRDLTFAQGHFDRSSFSLNAAKRQWEAEQQAIKRQQDYRIARIGFELQRIASTRAILHLKPELALQPRKLAAAAARRCGQQATDIDPEVPCNLTRTLS